MGGGAGIINKSLWYTLTLSLESVIKAAAESII